MNAACFVRVSIRGQKSGSPEPSPQGRREHPVDGCEKSLKVVVVTQIEFNGAVSRTLAVVMRNLVEIELEYGRDTSTWRWLLPGKVFTDGHDSSVSWRKKFPNWVDAQS